jgi:hypothetical protein
MAQQIRLTWCQTCDLIQPSKTWRLENENRNLERNTSSMVVADKFDKELKQHWPETHAKLLAMFKNKVAVTVLNALGDK